MRIFQEEIFGPVVAVTSFNDYDDAIGIANDTLYGLGAGVWTRDGNTAYRAGRDIKAGRVWTNCYHAYPAHAAFGGYKQSGIGRENHHMMLDHYQQTKNLLVSYSTRPLDSSDQGPKPLHRKHFHDWNDEMTQHTDTPTVSDTSTDTMRAAVVTEFGAPAGSFRTGTTHPRLRGGAGEVGDLRRMPHRSACRTW